MCVQRYNISLQVVKLQKKNVVLQTAIYYYVYQYKRH